MEVFMRTCFLVLMFAVAVANAAPAGDTAPSDTPPPSTLALSITNAFPEAVPGQQGIATDGTHIYVQSTFVLAKYDRQGTLLAKTEKLEWHHGGITYHEGHVYAAVSECAKEGTDKHWVYVYDAESLTKSAIYDVSKHFTVCAGGIAYLDGHFYVAESYYDNDHPDYVVQFDTDFHFVAAFTIDFKCPYGIQGLAYLPESDKFMVNSHGKPFYLISRDFRNSTLERGEAPFAMQDIAHFNGTALVLNDRPGRRIVFAELTTSNK